MYLLPVIDLLDNRVVRGIAGRRSEYRPIESRIVQLPEPQEVAETFAREFGFRRAYVADLNAIQAGSINAVTYRAISRSLPELWIDAGISTVCRASELLATIAEGEAQLQAIVGLESLGTRNDFKEIIGLCGAERIVLSLDLRAGHPLTPIAEWRECEPLKLLPWFADLGVQRTIVLDLADVGTYGGTSTLRLLESCKAMFPEISFLAGGGVRGVEDLHRLESVGCSGALVASALHDGRLSRTEVARYLE